MSNGAQRIAVVAIHGVGDHLPEEMAKAVGGMLESRHSAAGASRYEEFESDSIQARIAPVKVSRAPGGKPHATGGWGPMDALQLAGAQVLSAGAAQQNSIDHVFMEGQLADYQEEGPEDTYEFFRLQGARKADGTFPPKQVHIYDMCWSDLSAVGNAGLRVFGELYQILFHLGSVGVVNVAAAATFFNDKPGVAEKWDRFTTAQKWAAGALAFPVALLNLIILAFAVALFLTAAFAKAASGGQLIAAAIAVIAVAAAVWAYLLLRRGGFSLTTYRIPLIVAMGVAALAALGVIAIKSLQTAPLAREIAQGIVAVLLLAAALVGTAAIASAYDTIRPGAREAFWWILPAVPISAGISLFAAPWTGHRYYAMAVLVRSAEVGFCWLTLSWVAFWASMIWAVFAGRAAVGAVRSSELPGVPSERERASRTNWTARLTIGLPAAIFLLVTFAAWGGLLNAALPLLPRDASLTPHTRPSHGEIQAACEGSADTFCYSPLWVGKGRIKPARTWADEAFYRAGVPFLPVLLAFIGIAILISLYAMAPSSANEVSPPMGANPQASSALGNWLDQGFRFMRWAGRALYLGVLLFPPVMTLFYFRPAWLAPYIAATFPFSKAMGALVAGGAVGALAFGGRLSKLSMGMRAGVRVALDVDNWLREHPSGTNPTARICARYVTLLRYIANWKDAGGLGYDALVIFAHSQGTVITADLLRFLHVEASAAHGFAHYDRSLQRLKEIKLYFFTVGCPLQQLYGLRFPYLYGYACQSGASAPPPEPSDLGVTRWTNAYRTGDYVGRFLWRPGVPPDDPFAPAGPISPAAWDPPSAVPANVLDGPSRAEFAVGPGAHTHYWDKTADQVAEALDATIART